MTDTLPLADWQAHPGLARIVALLSIDAGAVRYVGGAVRDTLLGLPVSDVDLATPLLPETVQARLEAGGVKVIPTGIAHGTVTAVANGHAYEITTLRRDVATDGRRATVAFADDWRDDAARRDFTINALFADPASGAITDYFGGLDDLAARRVRYIGDAETRISEDHLRILRYFRFQARFGSRPADVEAEAACAKLAPTLKALSRERVAMELLNLLALPDPAPVLARMAELGVLAEVLPEADPARLAALVEAEQAQQVAPAALRRLAAILPADSVKAGQVAARLRLSTAQKKRLMKAAARGGEEDARALAYWLGRDGATDRLLLTGGSVAPLSNWDIPTLPVKGGDLVKAGVEAGPEVARLLKIVEAQWVAEGFPGPERVFEIIASALDCP